MGKTILSLEAYYKRIVSDPFFAFMVLPDGQLVQLDNMPSTRSLDLIPGSFNPLHEGHKAIYEACKEPEAMKAYEISINCFGKGHLSFDDLKIRLAQFAWNAPVLVTNASLFIEKCGLMSNFEKKPNFHVGFDTAERILQVHGVLGTQGIFANFIVYDRIRDGTTFSLKDLPGKPKNFIQGRMDKGAIDISSTQIRNKNTAKA